MSIILNIDTATERASVSLALEGKVLEKQENGQTMDHAAWIHTAINKLVTGHHGLSLNDLNGIAVVAGPGSYTGIRVGMATAKGLCYALNRPLISLNTLSVLAHAARQHHSSSLLCPMIDARRLEVFTALYDQQLNEVLPPCAMILTADSFSAWLDKQPVVFSGSGSHKFKELVQHHNAGFTDILYQPEDIAEMAETAFTENDFSELAYTEPVYLKDFYTYQK